MSESTNEEASFFTDIIMAPLKMVNTNDPHHVTLQLLQEIYGQRVQMQHECNRERRLRHDESAKLAAVQNQNEQGKFDDSIKIDELERAALIYRDQINELRSALMTVSKTGRSEAARKAAQLVERWK